MGRDREEGSGGIGKSDLVGSGRGDGSLFGQLPSFKEMLEAPGWASVVAWLCDSAPACLPALVELAISPHPKDDHGSLHVEGALSRWTVVAGCRSDPDEEPGHPFNSSFTQRHLAAIAMLQALHQGRVELSVRDRAKVVPLEQLTLVSQPWARRR